jgi:hypothetical protein
MTREERLDLIEQLRADADAGRERIAENRRRLEELAESDPVAFDDYLRAERKHEGSSLMRKSDHPAGLLYRTTDNALQRAPAVEREAFDEQPPAFDERQRDCLATVIAELRKEFDQRVKIRAVRFVLQKSIADLQAENAEIKGMLGATLQLLGQKMGNITTVIKPKSDVVDLPNWRRHGSSS